MANQEIIGATEGQDAQLAQAAQADICMLTTFNRTDGRSHEVEMRFVTEGDKLYMLSTEGGDAQWVQNLLSNPEVSIRIGNETVGGMGRVMVNDQREEAHARELLARKYPTWDEAHVSGQDANDTLVVLAELRV